MLVYIHSYFFLYIFKKKRAPLQDSSDFFGKGPLPSSGPGPKKPGTRLVATGNDRSDLKNNLRPEEVGNY